MKKYYTLKGAYLLLVTILVLAVASCKKESHPVVPPVVNATPVKLGLYELSDTSTEELQVGISKIGTLSLDYGLVWDTGSGGMVIDATGIIPAAMINANGFVFSGDSTVIDGITITKQTSTIEYGADSVTSTKVYGNLAYAPVTIGDQGGSNSTVVIKRLPFFLYYKAVDSKGNTIAKHSFDVMGVNEEYDVQVGGVNVTSPFDSFDPGTGLTKGFKMAALGTSNFTHDGSGPFVAGVVTVGLTAADLSTSSGFTMNTAQFFQNEGYLPFVKSTVTYNSVPFTSYVLFDSGTNGDTYIEDPNYKGSGTILAANTSVKIATTTGFTWSYTSNTTNYGTYIENPTTSGGQFTIADIEFFVTNEYMIDLTNHLVGLKNN